MFMKIKKSLLSLILILCLTGCTNKNESVDNNSSTPLSNDTNSNVISSEESSLVSSSKNEIPNYEYVLPEGHGNSYEDPLTVEEAIAYAKTLPDNPPTENLYFIVGEILSIKEYDNSDRIDVYAIGRDENDTLLFSNINTYLLEDYGTNVIKENLLLNGASMFTNVRLVNNNGVCEAMVMEKDENPYYSSLGSDPLIYNAYGIGHGLLIDKVDGNFTIKLYDDNKSYRTVTPSFYSTKKSQVCNNMKARIYIRPIDESKVKYTIIATPYYLDGDGKKTKAETIIYTEEQDNLKYSIEQNN